MSSLSDHTIRDAQHAARSAIRVEVSRYIRRMDELAKGHIKEAIEQATQKGESVDGTELGEAAGVAAIAAYTGSGGPRQAIESSAAAEPDDAKRGIAVG